MKSINEKWELRKTVAAIKRLITEEINIYTIVRMKHEINYVSEKLKKLEENLKLIDKL